MGTSIVVDSESFATDVMQQSYEKPVVVDFYATWCGPCQMLKPMLEKLVREYDFVLAKIDIDQNPDLASAYGIEGVPDVRVVSDGQMMPGFVGVLPEPQLRQFLAQLNLKSDLEIGLEAIWATQSVGNITRTQELFNELIEKYPEDRRLMLAAAQFLVSQNRLDSAEKLVDAIQMPEREFYAKAQAVKGLIRFRRELEDAAIASDLDQHYFSALRAAVEQDYETALQTWLEIVSRDRQYRQDGARKAMLVIFDLLGDDHPLTRDYRKKLMMALY